MGVCVYTGVYVFGWMLECVCVCVVWPTLFISAAAGQRTLISDSTEENTRFALKTIYYIVDIHIIRIFILVYKYGG